MSDVHLGLQVSDPAGREERFVSFLKSIPAETTRALYLLGDIWDFWYEYKYVVPKGNVRVFAALLELMDAGVEVYFMAGNHDMWCFHYFEELSIKILRQPYCFEADGIHFCVGHGDGLGPVPFGYRLMHGIFSNRIIQALFSTLHPTLAFALGNAWSRRNRLSHAPYRFRGEDEPLYRFAAEFEKEHRVDYFIFGHYHAEVDMTLPGGARLLMAKSWMEDSPYWYSDGISVFLGHSKKIEK
ncbi:MAG: UDP-2,3-diacylglucosamine diphosphatase [Bacteroidales bacterium]|nr:UDP-2,3-diacylglucosamine diphosphatase [Bacteroidales bacterium]